MYDRRLRRKADKQFIVVAAILIGLSFIWGLAVGEWDASGRARDMILHPANEAQEATK